MYVDGTTYFVDSTTNKVAAYFADGTTYKIDANGNAIFKDITAKENLVVDLTTKLTGNVGIGAAPKSGVGAA